MQNLATISDRLNFLRTLASRESILLDDVGHEFTKDLQNFIVGQTVTIKDGKVVVGNNLYRRWLSKVASQGFDFEIDFKQ